MKKEELTEEGDKYNAQEGNIMEELIKSGYLRKDVIAGINHCANLNSFDEGEEIVLFIQGILWERKRQNKLKRKKK
jgi:hypothetical protein